MSMSTEQAVNWILTGVDPKYGESMFKIIYDSRKMVNTDERDWDDHGKEVRKVVRRLRRQGTVQTVGGGGGKNTHYALVVKREAYLAEKKAEREENFRRNAEMMVDAVLEASVTGKSQVDALIVVAKKLGLNLR